MSKERLSKLQRWILKRGLENTFIDRKEVRQFWGKKLPPSYAYRPQILQGEFESKRLGKNDFDIETRKHPAGDGRTYNIYIPKKELISTEAIEASISRSIKNLLEKGLLKRFKEGFFVIRDRYCLTDKGFLKVNEKGS